MEVHSHHCEERTSHETTRGDWRGRKVLGQVQTPGQEGTELRIPRGFEELQVKLHKTVKSRTTLQRTLRCCDLFEHGFVQRL